MRAYKCDRCGSFYEKYTMQGEVVLVDRQHYTKDICPECYKELEKWYKNEQVQEDIPDCKYCKWIGSPESLGKCKTCIRGSNFEVSEAFTPVDSEKGSEDKV